MEELYRSTHVIALNRGTVMRALRDHCHPRIEDDRVVLWYPKERPFTAVIRFRKTGGDGESGLTTLVISAVGQDALAQAGRVVRNLFPKEWIGCLETMDIIAEPVNQRFVGGEEPEPFTEAWFEWQDEELPYDGYQLYNVDGRPYIPEAFRRGRVFALNHQELIARFPEWQVFQDSTNLYTMYVGEQVVNEFRTHTIIHVIEMDADPEDVTLTVDRICQTVILTATQDEIERLDALMLERIGNFEIR